MHATLREALQREPACAEAGAGKWGEEEGALHAALPEVEVFSWRCDAARATEGRHQGNSGTQAVKAALTCSSRSRSLGTVIKSAAILRAAHPLRGPWRSPLRGHVLLGSLMPSALERPLLSVAQPE